MVDFIDRLTEQLNLMLLAQGVQEQVLPDRTKEMVIRAADETLVAAQKGYMRNQYLESKEVAYVVASLVYDQPGFDRGMVLHAPKKGRK